MRALRITTAVLAVAALLAAPEAVAKKGHKKGHKKGPRVVRVDRIERRDLERDLAALVATRPRLPDGSRIVLTTRPPTARTAASVPVRRSVVAARPPVAPTASVTAQRRSSAVDDYMRSHQPTY